MTSSYDIYTSECARLRVHPNSALLNVFAVLRREGQYDPSHPEKGKLQVMQLEENLLGPRGLLALLPVLSFNSQVLHTLRLNGNRLRNESVYTLRHLLYTSFPALRVVDLSDNPFTYRAAKSLAEMAEGLPPLGVASSAPAPARTNADDRTPLLVRLKEQTASLGNDNNIDQILLDGALMSEGQQACVEQRIRDAIHRREQRKMRWQKMKELQSRVQPERPPAPIIALPAALAAVEAPAMALPPPDKAENATPHVQLMEPPPGLPPALRGERTLPVISSVVSSHLGSELGSGNSTPRTPGGGRAKVKPPRPRPPTTATNPPPGMVVTATTAPPLGPTSSNNVLLSTIQSFTSRLTDEDSPKYFHDNPTTLPNYATASYTTPLVFGNLSTTATPYTTPSKVINSGEVRAPTPPVPAMSRIALSSGMMNGADSSSSTETTNSEEEEEEDSSATTDDDDDDKHKSSRIMATVMFTEGNTAQNHPVLGHETDGENEYEDDFDDDDNDDGEEEEQEHHNRR